MSGDADKILKRWLLAEDLLNSNHVLEARVLLKRALDEAVALSGDGSPTAIGIRWYYISALLEGNELRMPIQARQELFKVLEFAGEIPELQELVPLSLDLIANTYSLPDSLYLEPAAREYIHRSLTMRTATGDKNLIISLFQHMRWCRFHEAPEAFEEAAFKLIRHSPLLPPLPVTAADTLQLVGELADRLFSENNFVRAELFYRWLAVQTSGGSEDQQSHDKLIARLRVCQVENDSAPLDQRAMDELYAKNVNEQALHYLEQAEAVLKSGYVNGKAGMVGQLKRSIMRKLRKDKPKISRD
jgi:predicted PP-loop superfamily ATPase